MAGNETAFTSVVAATVKANDVLRASRHNVRYDSILISPTLSILLFFPLLLRRDNFIITSKQNCMRCSKDKTGRRCPPASIEVSKQVSPVFAIMSKRLFRRVYPLAKKGCNFPPGTFSDDQRRRRRTDHRREYICNRSRCLHDRIKIRGRERP